MSKLADQLRVGDVFKIHNTIYELEEIGVICSIQDPKPGYRKWYQYYMIGDTNEIYGFFSGSIYADSVIEIIRDENSK